MSGRLLLVDELVYAEGHDSLVSEGGAMKQLTVI